MRRSGSLALIGQVVYTLRNGDGHSPHHLLSLEGRSDQPRGLWGTTAVVGGKGNKHTTARDLLFGLFFSADGIPTERVSFLCLSKRKSSPTTILGG